MGGAQSPLSTGGEGTGPLPSQDRFVTTRWSIVLSSVDSGVSSQIADEALTQLCQVYWRPIFTFVCRRGHSAGGTGELAGGTNFDLRWAATVVERALRRLAEECERHGRRRVFDALSGSLIAERSEVSLADLARRLGSTEAVVKRSLHEMRERYRALLRAEVAETVEKPDSIEEEVRYLCAILALKN